MSVSRITGIIRSLQSDQDVQEILSDPDVMKAVQAGDISTLMANPKFMKLLNNKAIQQIESKMRQ